MIAITQPPTATAAPKESFGATRGGHPPIQEGIDQDVKSSVYWPILFRGAVLIVSDHIFQSVGIGMAFLVMALCGCSEDQFGTRTIESGGVTFLPGGQFTAELDGDVVSFSLRDRHYELKDGELLIDSQSYGTFSPGDEVRLHLDGRVTIGGVEREPLNVEN